jgi:hypothetical protein
MVFLAALAGIAPAPAGTERRFGGRVTAAWDEVFNELLDPPANLTGTGRVAPLGLTKQSGTLFLVSADEDGDFPAHGRVRSAQVIMNWDTGRSRGSALSRWPATKRPRPPARRSTARRSMAGR